MDLEYVYRLRHKPSGLFFRALSFNSHQPKNNLSAKGRVYTIRPNLKRLGIGKYIYAYTGDSKHFPRTEKISVVPEDWEVVRYRLFEE